MAGSQPCSGFIADLSGPSRDAPPHTSGLLFHRSARVVIYERYCTMISCPLNGLKYINTILYFIIIALCAAYRLRIIILPPIEIIWTMHPIHSNYSLAHPPPTSSMIPCLSFDPLLPGCTCRLRIRLKPLALPSDYNLILTEVGIAALQLKALQFKRIKRYLFSNTRRSVIIVR